MTFMLLVGILAALMSSSRAFVPNRAAPTLPLATRLTRKDTLSFHSADRHGAIIGMPSLPSASTRSTMLMAAADGDDKDAADEKDDKEKNLFAQIKSAGVAGSVSLFLWEGAFWAISIPVALFGYQQLSGHWPDLSDKEDLSTLGASAFAFANAARFALPLRLGLAVSTTPWVQANIVDKFMKGGDESGDATKL